jgi:hypothetical protein
MIENKTEGVLTEQEENWLMMMNLHMPWQAAKEITDPEDRKFLVVKSIEIQHLMEKQHRAMMEQQGEGQNPNLDFKPPHEG